MNEWIHCQCWCLTGSWWREVNIAAQWDVKWTNKNTFKTHTSASTIMMKWVLLWGLNWGWKREKQTFMLMQIKSCCCEVWYSMKRRRRRKRRTAGSKHLQNNKQNNKQTKETPVRPHGHLQLCQKLQVKSSMLHLPPVHAGKTRSSERRS